MYTFVTGKTKGTVFEFCGDQCERLCEYLCSTAFVNSVHVQVHKKLEGIVFVCAENLLRDFCMINMNHAAEACPTYKH